MLPIFATHLRNIDGKLQKDTKTPPKNLILQIMFWTNTLKSGFPGDPSNRMKTGTSYSEQNCLCFLQRIRPQFFNIPLDG